MEAEIILSFIPRLKTAICDDVLSVSDECLANGLISETVYKRVLESGGISEDKARNLILAVKKSTETDKRCFELFLTILDQKLPSSSKDALLSAIKSEFIEKSSEVRSSAVIPANADHGSQLQIVAIDSREIVKRQTTIFGRLEDAIRQHERACAEKSILEERIKSKEDENEQLKSELESLKSRAVDPALNVSGKIEDTESRISACETEMGSLKGRIDELESIIEEQGMQVKRGRNIMSLGMRNVVGQLTLLAKKEIDEVKQLGVKKEEEHLAALGDKETQLEKKEEELQAAKTAAIEKEASLLSVKKEKEKEKLEAEMQMKSLQHEIALQGKDVKSLQNEVALKDKIKELELYMARLGLPHNGASSATGYQGSDRRFNARRDDKYFDSEEHPAQVRDESTSCSVTRVQIQEDVEKVNEQ